MIAGMSPLVRAFFSGFDEATSQLILWTTRVYLLTLTGFVIHEVAARSFYARKEPLFPLAAVALRLVMFVGIGVTAVTLFREIGAPVIAFAEIAVLIEAVILLTWLSNRTHEPIRVFSAVIRGVVAAAIGGTLAYLVAWLTPGGAVTTSLLGMTVGGIAALPIIWPEVRLLFKL
jgi:peptidoglycan biosynthesis protein MviN/MurJ (putative lipid II flippase)